MKLTTTLRAYRTIFKVTIRASPFSLVYDIEATIPIKFEVESLRVAIDSRLTDSQSLKSRLVVLECLDENRHRSVQHIEAIQRRRKITFDKKKHNKRTLRAGMLVLF